MEIEATEEGGVAREKLNIPFPCAKERREKTQRKDF